jgi:hypothetical protein
MGTWEERVGQRPSPPLAANIRPQASCWSRRASEFGANGVMFLFRKNAGLLRSTPRCACSFMAFRPEPLDQWSGVC